MPTRRNMHAFRRAFFFLAVVVAAAAIAGCGAHKTTAPTVPGQDLLIQKVDALLDKRTGTAEDIAFIANLSAADAERLRVYYEQHPRPMEPDPPEVRAAAVARQRVASPAVLNATMWTGLSIPCNPLGMTGYQAQWYVKTTGCGGDADDDFFAYTTIPNAYADRYRLHGHTLDTRVALALTWWGWKLAARAYSDNGYILTCVGGGIHNLGITESYWNWAFRLYKA